MAKAKASHHKKPHPAPTHQAAEDADSQPQKPIHGLSAAHSKAVLECARTIKSLAPPATSVEASTEQKKKALEASLAKLETGKRKRFWKRMQEIEDQTNPNLYTPTYYEAQLDRAKYYMDIYIDSLPPEQLPAGGKEAMKAQFHPIVEAAVMETGGPKTVMGGALQRPHTGVFQTSWEFIHQAREVMRKHPALEAQLQTPTGKQDLAVLDEMGSQMKITRHAPPTLFAHGMPTTSFAGQGAAFAAMTIASYERFLANGGKQQDFNGIVVYQDHLLGASGAMRFRKKLEEPQKKGDSIADTAYAGNFLFTAQPYSGANDLNPSRITYGEATANDVNAIQRDKFVFARNRLDATTGIFSTRVKEFETTFLPEWGANAASKEQDIARVKYQRETGNALREEATDLAHKLATAQYNAKHKTAPIAQEQAEKMGLSAPARPSAAQKLEVCSILLRPIAPFPPRESTLKR